ncbi:YqgE/AlgH family protein [Cognatilysobacter xinjiangensis]|uniref:YqgE/AlgH family protein n=1 Tax=Cognatilysobacter xinjiangensis TaxID=546892 RepID=UPI001679C15A|nr:YqgE/AlgH family protein [Lysobacter xinjiangensis]
MSDSPTPLASQLLIALPSLAESGFSKSVALICQHDQDGALGIVVNRPSEYTVGEVLEQMGFEGGSEALRSQIVLNGGPVHRERGFVIHDGGTRWDSTLPIGEDLWLTTSREILEAMANGEGPEHAVVALGCAGWGAGQLEQELSVDHSWLTAPADPSLLFDTPLEERWRAAAGRIGVDFARLADYTGHA